MSKIRAIVVEDSMTVRQRLIEVLTSDDEIEVVAQAEDGRKAIELCQALRPDVISLDMMLPIMTGVAATEYIMAHCPTPILIVSSSTNRGELYRTYDALAAGAVDVLEKPKGDETDGAWEQKYLAAIKLARKIKVITHPRGRLGLFSNASTYPTSESASAGAGPYDLVVIGASTGGPGALIEVLQRIPVKLEVPILIVLHIGAPFGQAFSEWLDGQTSHRVISAHGGELLAELADRVVMAPPDRHLIVKDGRLQLTRDPERHSCRPSVDVLFESVALERGGKTVACLLTGMGRDGASGLRAIRQAGGQTIAQDEASCVVYGMPREAVLLDAAKYVLPLPEIGTQVTQLLEGGRR